MTGLVCVWRAVVQARPALPTEKKPSVWTKLKSMKESILKIKQAAAEGAQKEVKSEAGTEGGASSEGGAEEGKFTLASSAEEMVAGLLRKASAAVGRAFSRSSSAASNEKGDSERDLDNPVAPSAGHAPAEGAARGVDSAGPDAPDAPSVGDATTGRGAPDDSRAAQSQVQLGLEARELHASQVLQRSFRCHVARTIYEDERYTQLIHPANVVVGSVRAFFARRVMNYRRNVFPSVVMLKRNWRVTQARRRLQRMKYAQQHPISYKLICKNIVKIFVEERFEPTCSFITQNWASCVLGRAVLCYRARKEFWSRFHLIDKLENDIGLEMTAPVLIHAMATSLKWAEKNTAAARLQSCLRRPDAQSYFLELRDYSDFIVENAIMIQCAFRCYKAREKVLMWDTPKCQNAALMLQCAYRCYLDRQKRRERFREWEFDTLNAIIIQTQCRVWIAKQRFFMRELDVQWPPTWEISSNAARKVQRVFRGHSARDNLRCYILSKFMLGRADLEVRQQTSATRYVACQN